MRYPLVSVIMPVYNTEKYVHEAVNSVINQSYTNWELLVVNDGSLDKSESVIKSFKDPRIRYFKQDNKGAAAARNVALREMKGDYFCFLDSDDVLPPNSIEARFQVFMEKPDVSIVDGKVIYVNVSLSERLKTYQPGFKGVPFKRLIKISSTCYFGLSWMIKSDSSIKYTFNENMTHAEDLFFYISISEGKLYDFTREEVLYYRITGSSAMANLEGLEEGYYKLYQNIKEISSVSFWEKVYLKMKITKIMMLSHCFDGKSPKKSIKVFFKFLFA